MQPLLSIGDANDLAVNQIMEIYIGICLNKSRRADIEFVRDSVKRIPCPDSIATRIFPATVDWNVEICPRPQASWIDLRIVL